MTWGVVLKWLGWRGLLAVLLLVAFGVQTAKLNYAEGRIAHWAAAAAKAQASAVLAAREAERQRAIDLAAIAEKYEKDKRDAEVAQTQLVDALRAGTVRLRNLWQGCQATGRVSGVAASAAESDAAARDREASAARIVRAARDADDTIKRLQDVVRTDRK